MDFDKYQITFDLGPRPTKPFDPGEDTPAAHRLRAAALERWEEAKIEYQRKFEQFNERQGKLLDQFKRDALEECGLADHPARDKIYDWAWEHGHSNGLGDVHYWLTEAVHLLALLKG